MARQTGVRHFQAKKRLAASEGAHFPQPPQNGGRFLFPKIRLLRGHIDHAEHPAPKDLRDVPEPPVHLGLLRAAKPLGYGSARSMEAPNLKEPPWVPM